MTHEDDPTTTPRTACGGPVPVDEDAASGVLPGWDYADAFQCATGGRRPLDAIIVARALLAPSSAARRLLAVRDLVVRPVGLRAVSGGELILPVIEQSPHRVVSGLDDRHLDVRVVITVAAGVARCTTVVRRHGWLGRLYFAVVGPVHRRLVPRLLVRVRGRVRDDRLTDAVVAP